MPTFRTSQPDSVADPSRPHIVLVGLPGAGKTVVGARLARHVGRAFLDFDAELVRRTGMTINRIFARHGEAYFRQLERALTQELRDVESMVLAPGGGWVTQPDTVLILRPPAVLAYLRLSPSAALRHMGSRVDVRPLLRQPDPQAELERLLASRRLAYESADVTIDVERLYPQQVAERLAVRLGLLVANPAGADKAGS